MGNVGAIRVHPDQPSSADPALNSVYTDPIGADLVDDIDEFFGELIEVTKDPINYLFNEQWLVKELVNEPIADNPDEFIVKVVLSGVKLKQLLGQFKENEDDVLKTHYRVFANRKELTLTTIEVDPQTEEKKMELHSKLHPNREEHNFKCETWMIDKEGIRRSGLGVALMAEWGWVKPILACRFGQKVKVRSNVEVADSGGRSALSESMDDFFTAQSFYDALVAKLKHECLQMGGEIDYKNDAEFVSEGSIELPLPEQLHDKETGKKSFTLTMGRSFCCDPEGLQVCYHDRLMEELTMTYFYRIRSNPVRVEHWKVMPSGIRMGGGRVACELRLNLLGLMSESEITAELKGMAEDSMNVML
uniref:Uncharacterized protein n=1 Tax=Alexandrium andersonii TaxID=327968 RepID=A0A7S2HZ96_9DINO